LEKPKIKILLAEDNPNGSLFWEQILAEIRDLNIEFIRIEQLSNGKHLGKDSPDVILLDLSLPDGNGLELFSSVLSMHPTIPIVVVTRTDNQKSAVRFVLAGAQDCLAKSNISGFTLSRAMRYAVSRQKHLKQVNSISVIDELTGLYNRRGFLTAAGQCLKKSDQMGQPLLLVFADVDRLKIINDTLGHHLGDLALMETAHVLREAFRETDVLGRLSGDEFVALLDATADINEDFLTKRFQETLAEHNAYRERSFILSVSLGVSRYDPRSPCSIGDLLGRADTVMYKQKKEKNTDDDLLLFRGTKEPIWSVLSEFLGGTQDETIVRLMIPTLRKFGLDEVLSFQVSYWVAKGSRELKMSLIEMIEGMGNTSGGRALRMALFDDSEEIAALAARAMGKINFIAGLPVLIKAAKIRETRFPQNDLFLTAVCRSLGDMGQLGGISFLRGIVDGDPLQGAEHFSLALKLEAVQALIKINGPETLAYMEGLTGKKDSQLREAIKKMTKTAG
jgi:two-component system cell cycle response regulator